MAKILIVDDNPGNRGLLVDILRSSGHLIREASDGGEALALVSADRPDLVITDILMPTMDGYEFVRQMRSVTEIAHTPVIFWTAVFREHDARDLARECGVEFIITKPCTEATINQTVDACLHKTTLPFPVAESFDRDHLRLVMDKLAKQAVETAAVNARLDALLEAGLRLASETEPSRLLEEFCKSARHLISARFAVVGITSDNNDEAYVSGLSPASYPGLKDILTLHSVIGGLLSGPEPVRARNTSADPRNYGLPAGFPNFSSLLAAPIASPSRQYGWLCLFHRLGSVEFTEEDARLTGILGALAGRIYENRRLYAAAQAQKMDALGLLAGGMAHDFNNALNVILGYSQLLLAKSNPSDAAYHRIEEIHKAGERAAALTKRLLAFSGKQMLQPLAVNLADLLRDLEPVLSNSPEAGIDVVTQIEPGLGPVKMDPVQVQEAILSVVDNAREAMPKGGTLTIDLASKELDDSSARVFHIPAGRYVALTVTDSGTGMTPEVKQRAFDPFFTTKSAGQGVGLGLASVYGIVKQSGGHVHLASEPGLGTTCQILFPQDPHSSAAPATGGGRATRKGNTILVVEDDPSIRLLVEEILSSAGYRVIVAGSGTKAIQLADEHSAEIHLLLTDVVLPNMGGKEIAARIASTRPDIKVLFMSGYTGGGVDERETLAPSVEFLQKPFAPDKLCEKIGSMLSAPTSSIRRVLVVDDDPSLRNLLAQTLEGAGFQAFTAEDGREARMQVQANPIDLVITDLAMPNEEGMELIRALKKEQPGVKIVAMSGAFGTEVLRVASALGADISLVKPVSKETILQSIDRLSKT